MTLSNNLCREAERETKWPVTYVNQARQNNKCLLTHANQPRQRRQCLLMYVNQASQRNNVYLQMQIRQNRKKPSICKSAKESDNV